MSSTSTFKLLAGTLALGAVLLLGSGPGKAAPAPGGGPADTSSKIRKVLLLSSTRPVVCKLHIEQDGKSYAEPWEGHVQRLFAFLDRNNDGGLDNQEAKAVPTVRQFKLQLQGNPYLYTGRTVQATTASNQANLDANEDGKIKPEELAEYYHKQGAGPLQVNPYNYYRSGLPSSLDDALFTRLDLNKDGKLSAKELKAAATSLIRYDANDDEIVTSTEIAGQPSRTYYRAPSSSVSRTSNLVVLQPGSQRTRLRSQAQAGQTVLARYDRNRDRQLTPAEIGLPKEVFTQLDTSKDGQLDRLELLRLSLLPPDVELIVRLGKTDKPVLEVLRPVKKQARAKPDAAPTRTIGQGGAGMRRRQPQQPPVSLSLPLDGAKLELSRVMGRSYTSYTQSYKRNFDRQFDYLDKDKKGYITREQAKNPRAYYFRAGFDLLDRDGDDKLTKKELQAYLEFVSKSSGAVTYLTFTESGGGLFQMLDVNRDRRLTQRELRNLSGMLAKGDTDGDKQISRSEIPRFYSLMLSQGSPIYNRSMSMRRRPAQPADRVTRTRTVGPVWFRKMDQNRDGDLSPREFLGDSKDFKRMDTNDDDLLSASEAQAADALLRKK